MPAHIANSGPVPLSPCPAFPLSRFPRFPLSRFPLPRAPASPMKSTRSSIPLGERINSLPLIRLDRFGLLRLRVSLELFLRERIPLVDRISYEELSKRFSEVLVRHVIESGDPMLPHRLQVGSRNPQEGAKIDRHPLADTDRLVSGEIEEAGNLPNVLHNLALPLLRSSWWVLLLGKIAVDLA